MSTVLNYSFLADSPSFWSNARSSTFWFFCVGACNFKKCARRFTIYSIFRRTLSETFFSSWERPSWVTRQRRLPSFWSNYYFIISCLILSTISSNLSPIAFSASILTVSITSMHYSLRESTCLRKRCKVCSFSSNFCYLLSNPSLCLFD